MKTAASAETTASPAEARAIAKEAYIYGCPMVDGYRIQYTYFVNRESPEFKAPWNQLRNIPRVFTPDDKAVQTPNSDTPYSMIGLDLRAEPIVLTVPASLLVANPLNRYLLNSPMLPQFAKDADGGLTLLIQNASPGADKEVNWLPAPKGPFFMAMRLYWPKDEAVTGKWAAPSLIKVK